eukprot:scaffold2404_cov398-Prasinococcus_capsulatus_cf.AAC.46
MTKSYLTQQRQKLQSTLFMRQTRGRDADEWSKSVIDSLDHFVYAGHGRKSGLYRHEGPLAEPLDYSNLEVRLFGMGIVPAKRMNDALHELKASLGPTRLEVARHRSCAVVGGSGILKDARYGIQGTSIDSHEAVFRMNHHVPGSYASWVGNKTTYQLVYPEAWLIDGYDRNATVLFMPFSIHDLYFYIQSQSTNATKAESHTSRFRCWKQCPEGSGNEVGSLHWKMELSVLGRLNRAEVLMPSIRMAADHLLEGCRSQRGLFKLLYPTRTPKPSTGLMALILAYTICDSVTAYGFQGMDTRCSLSCFVVARVTGNALWPCASQTSRSSTNLVLPLRRQDAEELSRYARPPLRVEAGADGAAPRLWGDHQIHDTNLRCPAQIQVLNDNCRCKRTFCTGTSMVAPGGGRVHPGGKARARAQGRTALPRYVRSERQEPF